MDNIVINGEYRDNASNKETDVLDALGIELVSGTPVIFIYNFNIL